MIQRLKNKKGFSLIEIILAISIFALSVAWLTSSLIYGQQSSLNAFHRAQAVLLANEGLEASENIAMEDFNNLVNGSFGISIENNQYVYSGGTDIWDIYERKITISNINDNTKKVTSDVSWSQSVMDEGDVSFVTYITKWK